MDSFKVVVLYNEESAKNLLDSDPPPCLKVGPRDIVIVENIRLVRLLDLTADFGVKTYAKLTPIFKLRKKSKTCIQSCLYTVTLIPNFE